MKLILAIFIASLAASTLIAEDWPQWRGPNRDSAWNETGLVKSFPAEGLKLRWRVKAGWGYSSPIVAQGRVYLTDAELIEPKAHERVRCLDEATGNQLWAFSYEPGYPDWVFTPQGHRGPTPTPIVRDGKLYVLGGMGLLFCFDAATGLQIWKKDLVADFQMQVPDFGTDSSPLIDGERLILLIGGKSGAGLIALDRNTGREIWRALDERRPYSSPIVITAGGRRQLILWTQEAVTSVDPATGAIWWRHRNPIKDYSVATPVHSGDRLLIGGLMMKLDPEKPAATVLWPQALSRRVLSYTSTPLLQDGHVYSAISAGGLVCLNADTGQEVWRTTKATEPKSGSSIHMTPIGDRVLIYNESGVLILARLSAAGYQEISRATLIKPTYPFGGRNVVWAPPAYANRCVFVRSDEELACYSLAAQP